MKLSNDNSEAQVYAIAKRRCLLSSWLRVPQEMLLAQQPSQEPQDATFADSRFQLDYLTQPNALSDMLISWGQPDVLDRAQAADEVRRRFMPHSHGPRTCSECQQQQLTKTWPFKCSYL